MKRENSCPVCAMCGEAVTDEKDLCNNAHLGPCHLSCLLLDAMGKTEQTVTNPQRAASNGAKAEMVEALLVCRHAMLGKVKPSHQAWGLSALALKSATGLDVVVGPDAYKFPATGRGTKAKVDRIIQRAIDSFDGCGCACLPATKDEDGNVVAASTCLLCELKTLRGIITTLPHHGQAE